MLYSEFTFTITSIVEKIIALIGGEEGRLQWEYTEWFRLLGKYIEEEECAWPEGLSG